MTRLTWGAVGERTFEAGVDRGVLYVDGVDGVPWNGLVSVTEESNGVEERASYVDGIKYSNRLTNEDFSATLEAYTYPDEFAECDGTRLISNGLFATNQKRKPFGLTYRSKIGNDVDGIDHGYKIHILYDVLAAPSNREHSTITDSLDPFNFTWKLSTKPSLVEGFRPTAHFIIDSRETPEFVLSQIEDVLYGNVNTDPRLPSVFELLFIFESYNSDVYDAGKVREPYFVTLDGETPSAVHDTTIDGGTP